MRAAQRFIITVLFLLAAFTCYLFGVSAGGVVFLVLGVVFEGIFWLRVFKRRKVKAWQ